ncbi:MAG: hypothetical protein ABSD74_17750 [Rhizomicrobium sp.]
MSEPEYQLFECFLRNSDRYLEFGTGGSTCAASRQVGKGILSVDSSEEWLKKVADACAGEEFKVKPVLVYADIGPTGAWGTPIDGSGRDRWPSYYESVWDRPFSRDTDLYLVDGRFRVACFAQTLLNCRADALIAIHDFASRPSYHIVRELAREIASEGELSVFMPVPGRDPEDVREVLQKHRLDVS